MSEPVAHHRLAVCRHLGSLAVQVEMELAADWTLLFGPSGSGKSTLLRAACGLIRTGVCFERRTAKNGWLPLQNASTYIEPYLRGLRWAPQRASLLPHLTVQENVAFASRAARTIAHSERDLVQQSLELFRLAPLAARYPQDLSGGERQRVNLARAFAAPGCQLLLLDEPFAGIDRALRDELLPEMRAWLRQRGIPVLSVSHDVEEALQLKARVVLLREGLVDREGAAAAVLAAERERMLRGLSAEA